MTEGFYCIECFKWHKRKTGERKFIEKRFYINDHSKFKNTQD